MHGVSLVPGQTVTANVCAKVIQGDYLWRWTTRIEPAGSDTVPTQFDQSELAGMVLSPSKVQKSASNHVPQLSEDGLIGRRVLELMDGQATLEEIARSVTLEFPHKFARWQDALAAAADVAAKYSV
jgi:hypothetical protein